MKEMGMTISKIHAGHANMFFSSIFRETLAGMTGATIELYDTDGAAGAAKGAGIGCGIYKDHDEAFSSLEKLAVIEPDPKNADRYEEVYQRWKRVLDNLS